MNILILFSQPWRVGGAETHVEALIKGLSEDKIIMAVNKGSDEQKLQLLEKKYPNLQVVQIQSRGINIVQWVLDILKLSKIIKDNNIEIVSAQQRTAGIWAYLLYKLIGTHFVVTMHDSWHRAFLKKAYARIFSTMVVVSRNLTDRLINEFGFQQEQINFINNGIDFTTFVPQAGTAVRERLNISKTNKIILHVSRLSSIKGAVSLSLIDSMDYILQQNKECQLIIIGEGPLRAEIEEKAKNINQRYGNCVEVKDFTDNIVEWYHASDIVVGEGRVAIEAIACQRPIVAIRNNSYFFGAVLPGNIDKAVEVNFDGSTLPVTPEIFAEEINKAFQLEKPETEQISQIIYKKLSIAEMTEKYRDVFATIIRGNIDEKNINY